MTDEDIIKEAKKRFEYCEEMEHENELLWVEDLKFANGNSDNGYQWTDRDIRSRDTDGRPSITINKVKQHNLQITNEAKKGRSSPKVVPVDGGSDPEVAEIFNGSIKHIESQSGAESAYSTAMEFAVDAGLGYWLVCTDYADDKSFDQEIYIERVKNPLNIRIDPDIKKADGSDMRYGFVFDDIPRDEFDKKYGKDEKSEWTGATTKWQSKDMVRVCEYYRLKETFKTLTVSDTGNTDTDDGYADDDNDNDNEEGEIAKRPQKRKVCIKEVEWFLLTDSKILEKKPWPGKYIPIIRVVGMESVIDGKTVRSSHTRAMKDSQRVYNLWSSSAVEFVKLQGKQPYIAARDSIEGLGAFWDNLNDKNHPYLPYNHVDDSGNLLPPPKRQEPPTMAQAYIEGMRISSDDMQAVSGQFDGQFGKNINQQSGVALRNVERQGENATFHFVDNSDIAKRFTALILIDLIPKIYDTERILMIIGEDGSQKQIKINPEQQEALTRQTDASGAIEKIYNPSVGRYDVVSTVGASYETKRQEAAEAMIAMSQANPAIWQTHGDLIAKSQDWPMADEFAKRFEKIMPQGLVDAKEGEAPQQQQPDPQMMQQLQQQEQQLKQMDDVIQKMSAELESKQKEDQIAQQKIEIDKFNAETNRLKAQPQPQAQQPFSPENDPQMATQMHTISMRKADAEATMSELQAKKALSDSNLEENNEMTPQIEELNQAMQSIAQLLQGVQQSVESVAALAKLSAAPRRSELQLDESGMPVGSISYPMNEETQ